MFWRIQRLSNDKIDFNLLKSPAKFSCNLRWLATKHATFHVPTGSSFEHPDAMQILWLVRSDTEHILIILGDDGFVSIRVFQENAHTNILQNLQLPDSCNPRCVKQTHLPLKNIVNILSMDGFDNCFIIICKVDDVFISYVYESMDILGHPQMIRTCSLGTALCEQIILAPQCQYKGLLWGIVHSNMGNSLVAWSTLSGDICFHISLPSVTIINYNRFRMEVNGDILVCYESGSNEITIFDLFSFATHHPESVDWNSIWHLYYNGLRKEKMGRSFEARQGFQNLFFQREEKTSRGRANQQIVFKKNCDISICECKIVDSGVLIFGDNQCDTLCVSHLDLLTNSCNTVAFPEHVLVVPTALEHLLCVIAQNFIYEWFSRCDRAEAVIRQLAWRNPPDEIQQMGLFNPGFISGDDCLLILLDEYLQMYSPSHLRIILNSLLTDRYELKVRACSMLVAFVSNHWLGFEGDHEFADIVTHVRQLCFLIISESVPKNDEKVLVSASTWLHCMNDILIYWNHRGQRMYLQGESIKQLTPNVYFDEETKQWATSLRRMRSRTESTPPAPPKLKTECDASSNILAIVQRAMVTGRVSEAVVQLELQICKDANVLQKYPYNKKQHYLSTLVTAPSGSSFAYIQNTAFRLLFGQLSNDHMELTTKVKEILTHLGVNYVAFALTVSTRMVKRSSRWRIVEQLHHNSSLDHETLEAAKLLHKLERFYPSSSVNVTKRRRMSMILSGDYPQFRQEHSYASLQGPLKERLLLPQLLASTEIVKNRASARLRERIAFSRSIALKGSPSLAIGVSVEVPLLSTYNVNETLYDMDMISHLLGREDISNQAEMHHEEFKQGDIDDNGKRHYEDEATDYARFQNDDEFDFGRIFAGVDFPPKESYGWGDPYWQPGPQNATPYVEGYISETVHAIKIWSHQTRERVLLETRSDLNERDPLVSLEYAVERCEWRNIKLLMHDQAADKFKVHGRFRSDVLQRITGLYMRTPHFIRKFLTGVLTRHVCYVGVQGNEVCLESASNISIPQDTLLEVLRAVCQCNELDALYPPGNLGPWNSLLQFSQLSPFHLAFITFCVQNNLTGILMFHVSQYKLIENREDILRLFEQLDCPCSTEICSQLFLIVEDRKAIFEAAISNLKYLWPNQTIEEILQNELHQELRLLVTLFSDDSNICLDSVALAVRERYHTVFIALTKPTGLFRASQLSDVDTTHAKFYQCESLLREVEHFLLQPRYSVRHNTFATTQSNSVLQDVSEFESVEYYLSRGLASLALNQALNDHENSEQGAETFQQIARKVALGHLNEPNLLIGCCWFLESLGFESETLSVDHAALALMISRESSFAKSSQICEIFQKVHASKEQAQSGNLLALHHLLKAVENSETEEELRLVRMFCSVHEMPHSYTLLHRLSRQNDYLGFMYEAEMASVSPDVAAAIVHDSFADEIAREHMLSIIFRTHGAIEDAPPSLLHRMPRGSALKPLCETNTHAYDDYSTLLYNGNGVTELLEHAKNRDAPHLVVLAAGCSQANLDRCWITFLEIVFGEDLVQNGSIVSCMQKCLRDFQNVYEALIFSTFLFAKNNSPMRYILQLHRAIAAQAYDTAASYVNQLTSVQVEWDANGSHFDILLEMCKDVLRHGSQSHIYETLLVLKPLSRDNYDFGALCELFCVLHFDGKLTFQWNLVASRTLDIVDILIRTHDFAAATAFVELLSNRKEQFSTWRAFGFLCCELPPDVDNVIHSITIQEALSVLNHASRTKPYDVNRITIAWKKIDLLFREAPITPFEVVIAFYLECLDGFYGNVIFSTEVECVLTLAIGWIQRNPSPKNATNRLYLCSMKPKSPSTLPVEPKDLASGLYARQMVLQMIPRCVVFDLPRLDSTHLNLVNTTRLFENENDFDFLQDDVRDHDDTIITSKVPSCSELLRVAIESMINEGRILDAQRCLRHFPSCTFASNLSLVAQYAVQLMRHHQVNPTNVIAEIPEPVMNAFHSMEILSTMNPRDIMLQLMISFPEIQPFLKSVLCTSTIARALDLPYDTIVQEKRPVILVEKILRRTPLRFGLVCESNPLWDKEDLINLDLVHDIVEIFAVSGSEIVAAVFGVLLAQCYETDEKKFQRYVPTQFEFCSSILQTNENIIAIATYALDLLEAQNDIRQGLTLVLLAYNASIHTGHELLAQRSMRWISELINQFMGTGNTEMICTLLVGTGLYESLSFVFDYLLRESTINCLFDWVSIMPEVHLRAELYSALECYLECTDQWSMADKARIMKQFSMHRALALLLYSFGVQCLVQLTMTSRMPSDMDVFGMHLLSLKQAFLDAATYFKLDDYSMELHPFEHRDMAHLGMRAESYAQLIGAQVDLLHQCSETVIVGISQSEASKVLLSLDMRYHQVVKNHYGLDWQ